MDLNGAQVEQRLPPSELAGWAEYGYCASHSRYFWGLRLHLVCTLHGLPLGWALSGAKADEREVLTAILESTPTLARVSARPGGARQIVIADKAYYGRDFEAGLERAGVELLRPARKGEPPRPGQRFFKPLRQVIESINATFKGQLDLEHHQGKTPEGVFTRIAQRVLALTAAICQRQPRLWGSTCGTRHRSLISLDIRWRWVPMADVLVRDIPDEVLAGVDAHAARLGLSRAQYIRRRLAADATVSSDGVSRDDLRTFSDTFADLADPEVMAAAWR